MMGNSILDKIWVLSAGLMNTKETHLQ